ncbi:DUF1385 domain-containing protein [Candidatus Woesearchaeota archaeon]|nr:DUF1385 domain-containing protein [Candidatus Woesearchaeota archaeon]
MNIGGQALVEGVLIRSNNYVSTAVNVKGKIVSRVYRKENLASKYKKLYVIRGVLALWDMLSLGFKELIRSAETVENEKASFWELFISIGLAIILSVVFFILIPLYLSKLITSNNFMFNLVDGLLRVLIFVGYVLVISLFKDVRRTFEYHGAEHKAIACFENKEKLSVNNIKKYSPIHERCGTAFIFIVLIVSVFVFSLIQGGFWQKFLGRLVLIPLVAGISYEILKLNARYKFFLFKVFVIPGVFMQYITTREPDNMQIKTALTAVQNILKKEKHLD